MAISDCNGRAMSIDKKAYKKYFGLFNGWIAKTVLKNKFETPLDYPKTTGYLEFICVREDYRRCKIATQTIKEAIKMSDYQEYVLQISEINIDVINCCSAIGFKQIKTIIENPTSKNNYNTKVFMEYKNNNLQVN